MFRLGAAVLALTLSGSVLAQDAPIRIGVVGPFSGKSSTDMGESIRGGARVFADEVNRLGGLLGRRIELVERDDQALPDVGVKVVRELLELAVHELSRQRSLPARVLSQGQRRRIGLARLSLIARPV